MTEEQYGPSYWSSMDGGEGAQDSTLWEDIAHSLKEVVAIRDGKDHSGEIHAVDVGCGPGFLVRQLRRRGFDAWGLDISDYALSIAPEDTKEFLRQWDASWVDDSFFGRRKFEVVTCIETMEHIETNRIRRTLENLNNLLVPGGLGVFAICTNTRPGWDSDPTHVTIESRAWWQERLSYVFDSATPLEDRLRQFWLFSEHDGVFVVQSRNR